MDTADPKVLISNHDFEQILMGMGVPVIAPEDLEIPPEKVKSLCIYPALMEFYNFFPISTEVELAVSGRFSIAFPSDVTFGISDARVLANNGLQPVPSLSPFVNERNYNASTNGIFRQGQYDFQMVEAKLIERKAMQAGFNLISAKKIVVDPVNKVISGVTNYPGILKLSWAEYSLNFDSIEFRKRKDVIKLAKANVMNAFADVREQMNANTGMEFNPGALRERATKLEDEIMERWRSISKVVILRG